MAEKTFTDEEGIKRKVKRTKEPVEFDVFPEDFRGADRECGKTCGVANRVNMDEIKALFPGKGGRAKRLEITRSRAHLFAVMGGDPVILHYDLSKSTMDAIAKWDKTGKIPKEPFRVKFNIPQLKRGGGTGKGRGNGVPRKPAVRRGFYLDERTGKRMKYTIVNGNPIKVLSA